MNNNICENCDNFMFLYIDEEKKLYNSCKRCGNYKISNENHIYKTSKRF